jgi:antitoxin component YwqK of YwqJK toxin-antitoxin module
MSTENEIIKEYYPNGKLKMEKSYKKGKQDGATKVYYESGELGAERIFQNGKIKSIITYKDGRIIDEKTFK